MSTPDWLALPDDKQRQKLFPRTEKRKSVV